MQLTLTLYLQKIRFLSLKSCNRINSDSNVQNSQQPQSRIIYYRDSADIIDASRVFVNEIFHLNCTFSTQVLTIVRTPHNQSANDMKQTFVIIQ